MLPWIQGRRQTSSVMGAGPEEMEVSLGNEEMGLRAMAMKAIAQDLIQALAARNAEEVARVLECLVQCIHDEM